MGLATALIRGLYRALVRGNESVLASEPSVTPRLVESRLYLLVSALAMIGLSAHTSNIKMARTDLSIK
ncbi:hypothetical protein KTT_13760 [Tengunoibacter tsumagoiensis]|uniref:Uncharacterized protein n=1 Tax=Tengunoibacter tsumagoiensis TaxID=2014871 RepID=A0A401ZXF3_9CHLR|nr:hypothetical protein KTT_13760 [Tengunoibacter tsumagoiensis]